MNIVGPEEGAKNNTAGGMEMYPRVLVVSKTRITERDNSGASIGKWFGGWPSSKVAHVFSGGPMNVPSFFSNEYLFTGHDRLFGKVFDQLKRSSLGDYTRISSVVNHAGKNRTLDRAYLARIKRLLSKTLVFSGLWELLFPPKFSSDFLSWVQDFQPDVIYASPSDLSFMTLTLQLHRVMKIPVCLQVPDDYPRSLYRESPFYVFMRPVIERKFVELIGSSSVCLGTGEIMELEYEQRYAAKFTPIMLCDEPERYRVPIARRLAGSDTISIVYSGGLFHDRWQSLIDVAKAAQTLCVEGRQIRIDAFVPGLLPEAEEALSQYSTVVLHDALFDSEVPSTLKGADILLLPEGFDPAVARDIKLSISSKSHIYMMSERPIFVYGPAGIGVVEYARKAGWGFVVTERDIGKLKEAITRLAIDKELREQLLRKSRYVSGKNHDASVVREKLRLVLLSAASQQKSRDH